MAFAAKVILDSIGPHGQRITTSQLKYPRFIHAEFMTHREFSRNASSSRAIPVAKMIEQVRNDPAMPIHWGANQPGMQADSQVCEEDKACAAAIWKDSASSAANYAEVLAGMGLHKQVANRILEPFQWMHVIVTTASHTNFDGLRRHKDAQPEIKHLADIWAEAREKSIPQELSFDAWHLPYITQEDYLEVTRYLKVGRITRDEPRLNEVNEVLCKISAARCARVSYLTHDGKVPSIMNDLELFTRLAGSQPIHASPLEHQAKPDDWDKYEGWAFQEHHGNLPGWRQFRKMIPGEYIK